MAEEIASHRQDGETAAWSWRGWLLALICMVAGLCFHLLIDHSWEEPLAAWRQALAAFVGVGTISFVLTVERVRWFWALAFAIGWGGVIAFIGAQTAGYNFNSSIFDFPFFSGVLAVLLAAPMFQTMRDLGRRELPYARLHGHAWTDAVIGAASLAFVGVSFLLAFLIAAMFKLIGIVFLDQLMREEWFGWMLAGTAFGGAIGLLRERDRLVASMQKLVMVVFAVLAPVLAIALILFLISLVFTGLGPLWDSSIDTAPMMLASGAGALLLINAVIGNGEAEEDRAHEALHYAALALSLCILPLAIIAAVSLGLRIGQYGWTPERLWGVVTIIVALGYGAMGWGSVLRGRIAFDNVLREWQVKLAVGMVGLALFLALPIVDFGAISTRDQLARLEAGEVDEADFDWAALAFDFGPAGRDALERIAKGKDKKAKLATAVLSANNRWGVNDNLEESRLTADRNTRMRVLPEGTKIDEGLAEMISQTRLCRTDNCLVQKLDDNDWVVLGRRTADGKIVSMQRLTKNENGGWTIDYSNDGPIIGSPEDFGQKGSKVDVRDLKVEMRPVTRQQVFVNGKPVGQAFEPTAP